MGRLGDVGHVMGRTNSSIVLANGGITNPVQAAKILEDYPLLDGLGVARGVLGKPYLFSQIKEFLKKGKRTEYNFKKIKKIAIRHAELLYKNKKRFGMLEIRKHLVWYFKGFPGAAELRKKLVQVKSIGEIKKVLSSVK